MNKILLLIVMFCSIEVGIAQTTVYADAQTNSVSGLCIGCSITNAAFSVDNSTSTYGSMSIVAGVSATLRIRMFFPVDATALDYLNIGLGNPVGIVDASLLSSMTFQVKHNGSTVATYTSANILSISLLGGSLYQVSFFPGVPFDEVDVLLNYTVGALTTVYDYYASFTNYLLPIELSAFEASPVAEYVALSWETLSEKDNAIFSVQRSADGEHFSEITTMPGAGNSIEKVRYEFIDKHPAPGGNYYRIGWEDAEGMFTYSAVEYVFQPQVINTDLIQINAPYGSENMNIQGLQTDENTTILIYTITGELAYSNSTVAAAPVLLIEGLALKKGMYVVHVTNGFNTKSCLIDI